MVLVIGTSVLAMLGGVASGRQGPVLTDGDTFTFLAGGFAGCGTVQATDRRMNLRRRSPMIPNRPMPPWSSRRTTWSKVSSSGAAQRAVADHFPANLWEAGWLIAGYTDLSTSTTWPARPTAGELVRGPCLPGGQRFLCHR